MDLKEIMSIDVQNLKRKQRISPTKYLRKNKK